MTDIRRTQLHVMTTRCANIPSAFTTQMHAGSSVNFNAPHQNWFLRSIHTLFYTSVTLLCLLLPATSAFADSDSSFNNGVTKANLVPFSIQYAFAISAGMTFKGNAYRTLTQTSEGKWQLRFEASNLFAKIQETSAFDFSTDTVQPIKYHYDRRVFHKQYPLTIDFNRDGQTAVVNSDGTMSNVTISAPTIDRISMQLQLQQDLVNRVLPLTDQAKFGYTVLIDDSPPSRYEFTYVTKERLTTPIGQFDTIKMTRTDASAQGRRFDLWFAPSLGYALVRMEQEEMNGDRLVLNIIQVN